MSGENSDPGSDQEIQPLLFFGLHSNDVFAFGHGLLEFVQLRVEIEILKILVGKELPGRHDVVRSYRHPIGKSCIRIDSESIRQLVRRNLPVCGKRRHIFQSCRVQTH